MYIPSNCTCCIFSDLNNLLCFYSTLFSCFCFCGTDKVSFFIFFPFFPARPYPSLSFSSLHFLDSLPFFLSSLLSLLPSPFSPPFSLHPSLFSFLSSSLFSAPGTSLFFFLFVASPPPLLCLSLLSVSPFSVFHVVSACVCRERTVSRRCRV